MATKVLYTEYFDLDKDKKDAIFYIDWRYGLWVVTDNRINKQVCCFPSQMAAVSWIKNQKL